MNINDVGLQLSALLSEGSSLTPVVAKMLRKHLGTKDFQVEQTGDGGVQITLEGQVIAGPFYSQEEIQQALQEVQSQMSNRDFSVIVKGKIDWPSVFELVSQLLLGASSIGAYATGQPGLGVALNGLQVALMSANSLLD